MLLLRRLYASSGGSGGEFVVLSSLGCGLWLAGSASVTQVHKGKLRGSGKGEFVAVKVQRKDVEPLMLMDLANLKHFAAFLQTFELPFDLLSVVQELEEQVGLGSDPLLCCCRRCVLLNFLSIPLPPP